MGQMLRLYVVRTHVIVCVLKVREGACGFRFRKLVWHVSPDLFLLRFRPLDRHDTNGTMWNLYDVSAHKQFGNHLLVKKKLHYLTMSHG